MSNNNFNWEKKLKLPLSLKNPVSSKFLPLPIQVLSISCQWQILTFANTNKQSRKTSRRNKERSHQTPNNPQHSSSCSKSRRVSEIRARLSSWFPCCALPSKLFISKLNTNSDTHSQNNQPFARRRVGRKLSDCGLMRWIVCVCVYCVELSISPAFQASWEEAETARKSYLRN